ncbi:hypothetical protein [Streptomyces sp. NPDC058398]|uniref:hypothetical protein n=1 Tax=Streptomyces sp. NPDC058398 TaxID=3346479 RepID=UPI0036686504
MTAGRALARTCFEGLPRGLGAAEREAYWGSVEVPYRPYYAYEEVLAVFGDAPGIGTSLLSAFERLTAVLSDGEVSALPPVPEPVRRLCVDAYRRRRPGAVPHGDGPDDGRPGFVQTREQAPGPLGKASSRARAQSRARRYAGSGN